MDNLKESYIAILASVLKKEPVTFKNIFESAMRVKATEYIKIIKEDIHKEIFNLKEEDAVNDTYMSDHPREDDSDEISGKGEDAVNDTYMSDHPRENDSDEISGKDDGQDV
jgi:hypothetical protein